jgi:hypothetical protein
MLVMGYYDHSETSASAIWLLTIGQQAMKVGVQVKISAFLHPQTTD